MPAKNIVKSYIKDGIYHIYNRGVEKRNIFLDEQDYRVFLKNLRTSLLPPKELKKVNFTLKGSTFKGIAKQPKNFHGKIECLAFCLMPNHFHLLVKQLSESVIIGFMQSIATRYSMYFNKRYKRVGSLFQSIYKATLITEDVYLMHITRYIHLNPQKYGHDHINAYSSYKDYIGLGKNQWVKPDIMLSYFSGPKLPFLKNITTYKKFVEEYKEDSSALLGEFTLENEV